MVTKGRKVLKKKKGSSKKAFGYVIVTGKRRDIKIKGRYLPVTKSRLGKKIFKTKALAIKKIRAFTDDSPIKAFLLQPYASKILLRNPKEIAKLKKAKEYIQR